MIIEPMQFPDGKVPLDVPLEPEKLSGKPKELMQWARIQTPCTTERGYQRNRDRHPVRLEIAAEPYETQYIARVMGAPEYGFEEFGPTRENVVARAYLAEPRCRDIYPGHDDFACECGPLAERKVDQ